MNEFKVIFIGSAGVGAKTNLINRIIGKEFNDHQESTSTILYVPKIIKISYGEIQLFLWDTPGQEKFRSLVRIFCKNSDCVVFGYAVDNKDSLDEIKDFYKLIYEEFGNLPLSYLVGNKIDLFWERQVTKEEGENYAKKYNMKYYEVSAKTGEGINELIEDISNSLINPKLKEKKIKKKNEYIEKIKKLNYYYNY